MRPETIRRPIVDWCGSKENADESFVGVPITIDTAVIGRCGDCGGRLFAVLADAMGEVVCESVIVIGD